MKQCNLEELQTSIYKQITYTVSASGKFLSMQLICAENTERSHTKGTKIQYKFDVTNSGNDWGIGTLGSVHKIKIPEVVHIASSKTTKPFMKSNVYEVNIEIKLYIMKPIQAPCIIIILNDKFRDSMK